MKPKVIYSLVTLLALCFTALFSGAQTIGASASAVWLTNCTQSNFYNTTNNGTTTIGPVGNTFTGAALGVHTQNSGSLLLNGAEVHTFKKTPLAAVCNATLFYRVYKQGSTPGVFTSVDLPLLDNCDATTNMFPTGGGCAQGDQKWNRVMMESGSVPFAPVNLTAFGPGSYVLEIYYGIKGSSVSTALCNEDVVLDNSGNNYKAYFSIQAPWLSSSNPVTCNGSEGSITINALVPSTTYTLSYVDDGLPVGPLSVTSNANGEAIINGLNAGQYSDIILGINGCTTEFNADLVLSGAVITPRFNPIPAFCAGSTAPTLPGTSTNGITGTWSPATISNQVSGLYTFTPAAGQCAKTTSISVTVKPNITPEFSFGNSLSICAGKPVPSLPAMSLNGIRGTWSPNVVDNQSSGEYIFTPAAGQCALGATLSVTVSPNITPVFDFGTSLTFCAGGAVPALPAVSTNGVNGTWSAASISNQNSGTYTFTPVAGVCANTVSLTVTIKPNVTPLFNFGNTLTICTGDNVPTLPGTSTNGITGRWSPSIIDNQASGTYTFTADGGQCAANITLSVVVNNKVAPAFSFGSSLTICADGSVPVLTATSTNSITGTWSPAIVDNQSSGTYTFTPDAGQCATTALFNVTVNPKVTPVFSFGTSLRICSGAAVPSLPGTANNGITGTWSPSAIDSKSSGTYTFVPSGGQCAITVMLEVTVDNNKVPQFNFGKSLSVCAGGAVPALPATSVNGINGTWSPASVSNTNSGTYIFTPDDGQCATATTFAVTVNENILPSFSMGTNITICAGDAVASLPAVSSNGISGQWSPATVDNQASGTYTFTPDAGQCALQSSLTVTVKENVKPLFSFGEAITICKDATTPSLDGVSSNGIKGTWSPAAINNQNNGTYTFTPQTGQCAQPFTLSVTVSTAIVPVFNFGTSLSICAGEAVPVLPATDMNGVPGSWNKNTIDNSVSGSYIFTPDPVEGQCFVTASFNVTVTAVRTPAFDFGSSLSICAGGTVPLLSKTSKNGVRGTWSPAEIDNHTSGTYTFTPDAGQCATDLTLSVTVNENVVATFDFGTETTICSGAAVPALPAMSLNGIRGTWIPSVIDSKTSNVYNFTPDAGQCAIAASFSVTVTANTVPLFDFGTAIAICSGNSAPSLPRVSTNGIAGVWNAEKIDTLNSALYTFTPEEVPGQCIVPAVLEVTIQPRLVPVFSFGTSAAMCAGSSVPLLPAISSNGISGKWNPDKIDNTTSGTYSFIPADGQCSVPEVTFTMTVNPIPVIVDVRKDTTVTDGVVIPMFTASATLSNVSYTWSNTNGSIGLGTTGSGPVPSFTANNKGATPVNATINVVPVSKDGCIGSASKYVVTVLPLSKDVFVPNVFSPNGDGKNDVLMVYGNYISSIQMRIFNQWGQQVALIDSPSKVWDGNFKGKPSTVGVYVYAFEAIMKDGKTVKGKGNITLLR